MGVSALLDSPAESSLSTPPGLRFAARNLGEEDELDEADEPVRCLSASWGVPLLHEPSCENGIGEQTTDFW